MTHTILNPSAHITARAPRPPRHQQRGENAGSSSPENFLEKQNVALTKVIKVFFPKNSFLVFLFS